MTEPQIIYDVMGKLKNNDEATLTRNEIIELVDGYNREEECDCPSVITVDCDECGEELLITVGDYA